MATLKLLFGFGVILATIVAGIKVVPPFFSNYEFQDAIKADALQATYSTRTEDDIRTAVIKHAKDYDIPLTPQQVKVSRIGGYGVGTLFIEADYSVPLDLVVYSTTLDFRPSSQNKGVF